MKLTRYLYKGPQSAATLRVVAEPGKPAELLEVQLTPGEPVSLPPEHEYVEVLLVLKHLELLPDTVGTDKQVEPTELQSTDAESTGGKKGVKA